MSILFWREIMKTNGNQNKMSDYYVGLDVGTDSIGWAVTDTQYNIPRFKGNAMWGVRLFNEANPAAERRQNRVMRRRLNRRRQRLELLEMLFNDEIKKIDPSFFMRLKESALLSDDKTHKARFQLFNDSDFTDKDYFKKYPTVYHLRKELIESDEPHDIRLVYLALHHIIKSRGHFLFDMELSEDNKSVDALLCEFKDRIFEDYGAELTFKDKAAFISVLTDRNLGVKEKKKQLKKLVSVSGGDELIDLAVAVEMLSGGTVQFSKLFCDKSLNEEEKKSLSLKTDINESLDVYERILGTDRLDVILSLKEIYDCAKLAEMLGEHNYICEVKVEQYDINKKDLLRLKKFVRENAPDRYKEIFTAKENKLNNYAAYSGKTLKSGEYFCKLQEDFCKYLRDTLPELEESAEYADIYYKIDSNIFLPRLRGSDNAVIPHQLHGKELDKILENASHYLEFLNEKDENGVSVRDKISSVFRFKIPYYVGPLNEKSPHSWVVRNSDEKIYPWNFESVVDTEKSSQKFILNLIGRCPYTGDEVLPKSSLLFSEYCVLNEINPLSVNGEKIPLEVKNEIYNELFLRSDSRVTKKSIKQFLIKNGHMTEQDELSGVDDVIKSGLKSYHSFSRIMNVDENREKVEDIIRSITIFGEDKKILRKWLKNNHPDLTKEQTDAICRLKYKDWGRLSKTLLSEIYAPDKNGEAHSIIDMLRTTNNNLMQLLSGDYLFKQNVDIYRREKYGERDSVRNMIEEMYVSPSVKRSLLQTVKIVDEIVDIKKSAPKKIFIEVARDKNDANAKKRTVSRKEKLLALYKSCKKDYPELYDSLCARNDSDLRKDKLYLYYMQFGKSMYSGKCIDLENLDNKNLYDIDHIFPQSRIKDDSLDNRVLVLRNENHEKDNNYPIKSEIREKMAAFWYALKQKDMISPKKYERLVRHTPLSEDELSSFVARQLVETRQSTKALAEIMTALYKNAGTKIVYSKAGNVSDFRQEFELIKCRDVNDLHHAKDAYLNIVVGNVYDTKFTSNFFKNIKNEKYSLNKVFDYDVAGAWEKSKTIAKVKAVMSKNNILVTRKPFERKGMLSKQTIYPAGKGQLPIKEGRSIEKYGGYDKVSGAYFCVVEHTVKKKRVRTIEPVLIYKKPLYESDPIAYCTEFLGLIEPKIVYRRLLVNSLVELDGKRMYVTGRSGDSLLFKHDYQLSVSQSDEKYIKEISKYVSRSAEEKDGIQLSSTSNICAERNEELFMLFIKKLQIPVYSRVFSGMSERLFEKADKFCALSLIDQCRMLLKILKYITRRQVELDMRMIGGSEHAGKKTIKKSLEKSVSAFVIESSVTGLYRYRTDLL